MPLPSSTQTDTRAKPTCPEDGADKRRLMPPPYLCRSRPRRRRTRGQSPRVLRTAPTSGASCRRQSFRRGYQLVPVPWRLAPLPHHRAAADDEDARADPQLVEIVRDEQHRRPLRARAVDDTEQCLLRCDVDAGRRADDDEERRHRRESSTDDDLLLVAAAQLRERLFAAAGDDLQVPGPR